MPKIIKQPQKEIPRTGPDVHELLLSHILEKTHHHGDLAHRQREVGILQQERHKHEDHLADEVKIQLQHRANEKIDKTNEKLDELVKSISSLNGVFKDFFQKDKVKSFGENAPAEKKKLVLTEEILTSLKDLKTKTKHYGLLLNYLKGKKYGKQ